MDDGRFCSSMVDRQTSEPKPYALRATIYTVGFLLLVFGVVPSFFYIAEQYLLGNAEIGFWTHAGNFWHAFRVLVGVAVFSIGLAAYVYCSVWLVFYGKGPHVEFDHPKEIVTDGPFAWVRNPVILCLLVTATGMALYLASWGIAIFVALGMVFAQWQATKLEEPNLTKRFGDDYTDYCKRVNRWIPRPPSKD